jgi:hypothetical protein
MPNPSGRTYKLPMAKRTPISSPSNNIEEEDSSLSHLDEEEHDEEEDPSLSHSEEEEDPSSSHSEEVEDPRLIQLNEGHEGNIAFSAVCGIT